MPWTKLKPWLSPSVKQHQNPHSGPPAVYQDLSTCHVIWLACWKSHLNNNCNSLSWLGSENEDIGATCTSQMLLGKVYLCLQGRLVLVQRAEKVVSDSPGLVDFRIGPVKFFGGDFKLQKYCKKIGEIPYKSCESYMQHCCILWGELS